MTKGIGFLLGVVISICVLATPAAAQGTADMVGRVADSSGGILPGVTVTAAVAVLLLQLTVTMALPGATAVATPVDGSIFSTPASLVLHASVRPERVFPSGSRTVAANVV